MGERTAYPPGTFCWVDLSTPDAPAAMDFYGGLFGWELEEAAGVVHARRGGRDVAALVPSVGGQPHWRSHVAVASADDAARTAAGLGGTVLAEPVDAEGGRTAAVRDPSGAVVWVWEAHGFAGARLVNATGAFTWNDLSTGDVAAAERFYTAWLGWSAQEIPGAGGYRVVRVGGRSNGGMRPQDGVPPAWLPYFGVVDLPAACGYVAQREGRVLVPPMRVSEAGGFAVVADPQGATLALWSGDYDD